MAGMTAHPAPVDLVPQPRLVEPPPEVLVLDRSLAHGAPAPGLPQREPLGDAVPDVLAVGVQLDVTGALEDLQGLDGGLQLHAVVGGLRLAAPALALVALEHQQRAPAARAGIAAAGTVRVDHHARRHDHAPKPGSPSRWTASLRSYSSGSFGRTRAPAGVAVQSLRRVRKKRSAAP